MRKAYRRHNHTADSLLPVCASTFLVFAILGAVILVWFVSHLDAILEGFLSLAIMGNSFALLVGLVYLGVALITGKAPQQRIAPAHTVRIVRCPPEVGQRPMLKLGREQYKGVGSDHGNGAEAV